MSRKKLTKQEKMRLRKRRMIKKCITFFALLLILMILLVLVFHKPKDKTEKSEDYTIEQQEKNTEKEVEKENSLPEEEPPVPPAELPQVSLDGIYSKNAILVRLEDHAVVAEKAADEKIYPASMTKIMTAIVALENLENLEKPLPIDRETYDKLYLDGASLAGFQPKDQVRGLDMVYGVLLPSGAECCLGLAEELFGSEEAFVDKMNEKAKELRMNHTHFVTSTGLHDPEHYTTVKDLTLLLEYALKNEEFRKIYETASYTTAPVASAPSGLKFSSTMFKKMNSPEVNGGKILGGKTGYTSEAGLCLASLATIDEKEYILVTAGAQGKPSTDAFHVQDAFTIYNQIHK